MSTVQSVLTIAAAEIGVTESPAGSNRQKYSLELGRPAEPWCADFVVWVSRKAGLALPSESAYTPWMANAFRSRGMWHTAEPRPGDIAFFNFGSGIIRHVGIVEKPINALGRITTIEGNTSPGDAGSQDNGGGVYRRSRLRSHIVGFGRPAYVTEIKPMYDPPLSVCATLKAPNGGIWGLAPDGAIYGFEGAPYYGGANGQAYFVGRRAAQLEAHPSGGYTIVATSGERYNYPAA